MPAVHALLVARSASSAAPHLERTLEAIRAQTRPVDALTIVVAGSADPLRDVLDSSGATTVIQTSASTSYAAAVESALTRVGEDDAVWLLAQDTAPEPGALAALSGALERAPSVAVAAPKLVDWEDRNRIRSLGTSMTRFGRTVPLGTDEFDQGQHDAEDDVLGADIRGMLVRASWRTALLPDRALLGVDEGLDIGVRARLGDARVALAPAARIAIAEDAVAGPPNGTMRRGYASRTAQLHRRLAYAPAAAVPLHWLSLLPIALWRTVLHLIAKAPARVPAEWAAAVTAMFRFAAVARSRRQLNAVRTGSPARAWARVAPLRASRARLREHAPDAAASPVREDLRFFSGGGAWAVLAALAVSIASFTALLAWPALGGGALLPLRQTVGRLWADAAYGLRPTGIGEVAAADPFSGVVAVLGSLWPGNPSYAVVLLWLAALPLAVLGGWFAATRVTERSGVRAAVAVLWALAPTFLAALTQGRPAAVLLHLLLPWLLFTASVAHRSWGASGAASLITAAVLACAPSLALPLGALWLLGLLLVAGLRLWRGIARIIWLVVPAIVLFLPIVIEQLRRGNVWGIFADPGPARPFPAAEAPLLAAGFPGGDLLGWGALLGSLGIEVPAWWIASLVVPLGLLAVLAPLTRRWRAGIALLVVTVAGALTAFVAAGVAVSFSAGQTVPLWAGSALSLAWLGAVVAAAVTLDGGLRRPRLRGSLAALACVCLAVVAVAPLTAVARGQAVLTNGPESTLPAYVRAEAADDRDLGTIVLDPRQDGSLASRVLWGASETLGGQSTLQATDQRRGESDERIATITADLVASVTGDVPAELSDLGIRFVLLAAGGEDESDAERVRGLETITAIDQRAGLVQVGETARGVLWRLEEEAAPRPGDADEAVGRGIVTAQLAALLVGLLLAVPTAASRRDAHRTSRVVGRRYEEEL